MKAKYQSPDPSTVVDRYSVESKIFDAASKDVVDVDPVDLLPFSEEMFDADLLDINMKILTVLIDKARSSDVNKNKSEDRSKFNATTVAILGWFGGRTVDGSLISSRVKNQYFYQDDAATKSLNSPFSDLMLLCTTNYVKVDPQLDQQYLQNYKADIVNWIALRSSFEFDPVKGDSGQFATHPHRFFARKNSSIIALRPSLVTSMIDLRASSLRVL